MTAQVNIRYNVLDILATHSPCFSWTLQQYITAYHDYYSDVPSLDDLKRLFPDLLVNELVLARDIAKVTLEKQL